MFQQASEAIIITDFRGKFLDANSSFCKMFGYTLEELLRMNISETIEQEEITRRPINFGELAAGAHILNDRRMVAKDGSIREVEANVKSVDNNRVMATSAM
ncbi:MAG: PAS domain S-box protein [Bacteroidota bacterium]